MSQELLNACANGTLDEVKNLLTDKDNFVDIHYKNHKETAFLCACKNGHLEIVQYLLTSSDLKEHANIHDRTEDGMKGWNTLILSCHNRKWDIAHYLIMNQNMTIDKETMDWLIRYEEKEILKMIQSRDLYQKMNNNLNIKNKS